MPQPFRPRAEEEALVLVHDGSWDGLLTAVYAAYTGPALPGRVDGPDCQQAFGKTYREVETDGQKAARVRAGITRTLGGAVYDAAWTAFLAGDPGCSNAVYRYLRLGFESGREAYRRLSDDRVIAVNKRDSLVRREASHLLQFVRFSQRAGGVYYAAITPEYPVLPLIMPHFAARFRTQPFVLHDLRHRQAGVSSPREWVIADASGLTVPDPTAGEQAFQRLWKTFYDSVAIPERANPQLRRQLMPKKFWPHLPEMTLLPDDPETLPLRAAPRRLPEQEWAAPAALEGERGLTGKERGANGCVPGSGEE